MGECLCPDKRSTLNGGRGNPQSRATVPSSGYEGREAYSTVMMTHAVIQNQLPSCSAESWRCWERQLTRVHACRSCFANRSVVCDSEEQD